MYIAFVLCKKLQQYKSVGERQIGSTLLFLHSCLLILQKYGNCTCKKFAQHFLSLLSFTSGYNWIRHVRQNCSPNQLGKDR